MEQYLAPVLLGFQVDTFNTEEPLHEATRPFRVGISGSDGGVNFADAAILDGRLINCANPFPLKSLFSLETPIEKMKVRKGDANSLELR